MEEESLPLMTEDIRVDLSRVTLSFQSLIEYYDKRTQRTTGCRCTQRRFMESPLRPPGW
jgi:hypothetical protein